MHESNDKKEQETSGMDYLSFRSGQWKVPGTSTPTALAEKRLSVMTINVLTDCVWEAPLKRNLLFSTQRYERIIQEIVEMLPHVVTFNQATQNFHRILINSEEVRKNYFVSGFFHKQKEGSFNIIMSRVQPLSFYRIKINKLARDVLTFLFKLPANRMMTISCAHLTSLTKNHSRRKEELKELDQQLRSLENKESSYLHIIQGDLNIHSEEENINFETLGIKDAWLNKLDLEKNPGYTFDGLNNSLIHEVYWGFQKRRMRLDRILMKGKAEVESINIVLNQPLYPQQDAFTQLGLVKGVLSFASDIMGYNIFRKKQRYLFPSDHFGLFCILKL